MNRWKRERTETLIHMQAHNQWSRWYDAIMTAAEDMRLPVGQASFRIHDGSIDRIWYTSAPALERLGGKDALYEIAEKHHEMLMR